MKRDLLYFEETIYDEFFINGDKFTVEDYDTDSMAVYHEGMFVGEIESLGEAVGIAVKYEKRLAY